MIHVRGESLGLNSRIAFETGSLESEEDGGIPSVEVKFVDIRKNTGGEGGHLARY